MTDFVFPLELASVVVQGSTARFPVRRIWCVGRNYAEHARELGNDEREPPMFFGKQPDMVAPSGVTMPYPGLTQDLHHEVELVVALKAGGTDISEAGAAALIYGHAVGIDLTRRDLQKQAQAKGKPWEVGKSFEQSAPLAAIKPASSPILSGRIRLSVNGQMRQDSDIDRMTWNIPEIIARLSRQVALGAGDLIFTGTPAGVGQVVKGDRILGEIDGLESVRVTIA